MKIYIDTIIFDLQTIGGISVYWFEMINRFASEAEFEVILIDSGRKKSNLYYDRIEKLNIKTIITNKFLNRYRSVNYDEAEKHFFVSTYYRYSKNKKAVNLTVVHDFTYEYFAKGLKKSIHSRQKNKAINISDMIFCISENTKNDLIKFVKPSNTKIIKTIYNGVSDKYCIVDVDEDAMKMFNDTEKSFINSNYILYVGSRAKYKNWDLAVDVLKKLPGYNFISVGGGNLNESELQKIKPLEGRYIQMPPVSEEKLVILYNKAAVLLYLSDYEGFGIPVAEAQKCGCPVIALNRSSIPEVAGSGTTLYDSKEELLKNTSRLDIARFPFVYEKEFSWDNTYRSFVAALKQVYSD